MAWKVTVNTELGCIETVYTGRITKQESLDATAESLSLARGNGPRFFLADLLNAQSDLSTLEIYKIPEEWKTANVDRGGGLALVVAKGGQMWADAQFYENTCRNRGWNVRVFSDRQEAIDWLTAIRSSKKVDT